LKVMFPDLVLQIKRLRKALFDIQILTSDPQAIKVARQALP